MKIALPLLLAVSLAANVLLFWRRPQAVTVAGPAPTATAAAPAGASRSFGPASSTGTKMATPTPDRVPAAGPWRAPQNEGDLRTLVAQLRAAGYPPSVVRAIVQQILADEYFPRTPAARLRFWEDSLSDPKYAVEFRALEREKAARLETLLGEDGRPSALLDAAGRERRYGPLATDKIDRVARIEQDYEDLRWKQMADRRGRMIPDEAMAQAEALLRKEMLADITAVLTPEELEQYQMRTSPAAGMLKAHLRGTSVSPDEYAALYRLRQRNSEAFPPLAGGSTVTAESWTQRQAAQMKLNDEVRGVLNDDRFYSYLAAADHTYAQLAKFTTGYPQVTPAATYEVYKIQTDAQSVMTRLSGNREQSPEQKMAEMRALGAGYEARLRTLLGPEATAAYLKQGPGRAISSMLTPRPTPRPPGGG